GHTCAGDAHGVVEVAVSAAVVGRGVLGGAHGGAGRGYGRLGVGEADMEAGGRRRAISISGGHGHVVGMVLVAAARPAPGAVAVVGHARTRDAHGVVEVAVGAAVMGRRVLGGAHGGAGRGHGGIDVGEADVEAGGRRRAVGVGRGHGHVVGTVL